MYMNIFALAVATRKMVIKDGKVKKVNVAYINGEHKTLKRITEFYKNIYDEAILSAIILNHIN